MTLSKNILSANCMNNLKLEEERVEGNNDFRPTQVLSTQILTRIKIK